ncbi:MULTISPECIES: serine hydroxymethyltransferase [Bacillus]|uniref:Serine hydroxymethyltransferase n=2 Tax=Bacillus TaxID=1386 RepID=A0A0M4FZQ2_9BACI|nr:MULTISPECIES: serine hydroxymethyltransferase [Bacillus]ALC83125.1 serine hydroxymethyltransferase [Bacillus gobiensis]MBP1082187.1 glycine hydroxymethyltransferase [Bacillus capparidis]MED1096801.1 serine hydroxymethyltransferase [Bacillus capparidis]
MSTPTYQKDAHEVHDPEVLSKARAIIEKCSSPKLMQKEVIDAVERNAIWRGEECLNLLAPEAPTSPTVRKLLASEVGTRAAEGHIGPTQRWFAGTTHIDEIEALCVELLKKVFKSNYADHRLVASMLGNLTVYAALTKPGDNIMTIPQPTGGHSSNRYDGPAGIRGLNIYDVPMDPQELTVDLDAFAKKAREIKPRLVALGASMTLFPFPLKEMTQIVQEWGGKIFFDGAHQLGLIGGGQFQDPLSEGACVMTGSSGKTFSGPQSGIILWNDPEINKPITDAIFPALAATHQVNRVAALAAAAAEFLAFGEEYMAQIVKNSKALGKALHDRGVTMLGAHKGFTKTHQVIADVRSFGNGLDIAKKLGDANIITNKNLIPSDKPEDWDYPSGLRIGTTEVTRLGMKENDMETVADFMIDVLEDRKQTEQVRKEVIEFRKAYQKIHYCFD